MTELEKLLDYAIDLFLFGFFCGNMIMLFNLIYLRNLYSMYICLIIQYINKYNNLLFWLILYKSGILSGYMMFYLINKFLIFIF